MFDKTRRKPNVKNRVDEAIEDAVVAYAIAELGDVQFSLTNAMGQVMWHKRHSDIPAGDHMFNVEMTGFASGIYFLNMEHNGQKVTKKLVIQH